MFTVKKLNDEITKKIESPGTHDYVDISDSKNHCVIIQRYVDLYAEKIKNFQVYEDDVWVVTFPKCGTTWTQEMVWMLNNNLDYETALTVGNKDRFPFLEIEEILLLPDIRSFEACRDQPRPRHIKSHLPVFLLPDQLWTVKPKIIYAVRNPKDTAVSFFHHYRHIHGYNGTRSDFINAFLNDKVLWAPLNDHALEFWKLAKENSNILFLFYEDMKKNLDFEVKKVMKFLSKNYCQEEIDKLCKHLSFDSMKKNPTCSLQGIVELAKDFGQYETSSEKFQFMREGKVGSYKKEMSENEIKRFDEYMNHPEFKEHGFAYKF